MMESAPLDLDSPYCEANTVAWTASGKTFQIHNLEAFKADILPKYFPNPKKYRSFTRQLQYYNFKNFGKNEFGHPMFMRNRKKLLHRIMHKTVKRKSPRLPRPTQQEAFPMISHLRKGRMLAEHHHKLVFSTLATMQEFLPDGKQMFEQPYYVSLHSPLNSLHNVREVWYTRSMLKEMVFAGNALDIPSPNSINQQLAIPQTVGIGSLEGYALKWLQLIQGLGSNASNPWDFLLCL
ncbi:unnamed protein product [Cylindrotheca closterium]|uniref:HSF-type DNA-binding domain-containing protein n=1 Tax=Cylindrotheca closterium TaxID=2856 RepID=A0AAD2G135_9STRA|nr:unnamed protein product [Cylindrotheca closterium]